MNKIPSIFLVLATAIITNVYVAGNEKISNRQNAKIWTNGVPTYLTDGTNPSIATSIFVIQN